MLSKKNYPNTKIRLSVHKYLIINSSINTLYMGGWFSSEICDSQMSVYFKIQFTIFNVCKNYLQVFERKKTMNTFGVIFYFCRIHKLYKTGKNQLFNYKNKKIDTSCFKKFYKKKKKKSSILIINY